MTGYSGSQATGSHVVAYWKFDAAAPMLDSSGHSRTLKLSGASVVAQGRFGGGLEPCTGGPRKEVRHAVLAANHPSFSPAGAFTVELWLKPDRNFKDNEQGFLVDKKYASNFDYQLLLAAADKSGHRRLVVNLGFEKDFEGFTSEAMKFPAGVWTHVAFTYDGAGEVKFFRDGALVGTGRKPGLGPIAPGKSQLSIGDRLGSNYGAFAGVLDEVRICQGILDFRPVQITWQGDRTTFRRMEKLDPLAFTISNLQPVPLKSARIKLSLSGQKETAVTLPELASGATHAFTYPLDTGLRPDEYELSVRVEIPGDKPFASEEKFPVRVVARPLPQRMPIVMWGVYSPDSVMREMDRLKDLGFTHCLGLGAKMEAIWDTGKPVPPAKEEGLANTKKLLDTALANDFGIIASLSPGHWLTEKEEFWRVNRDGVKREKGDVCGLFPQLPPFCENVGKSVAQAYGKFPAFDGALIHTEIRDKNATCFHPHDQAAFKKVTGLDIPQEVNSKGGVAYSRLANFPANRVVPENHPLLQYFRWFWTVGDGWPGLHTAVHRGLKTAVKPEFWTFHDPAVRCPSIPGSGGEVDVLSQWTYTYPEPIRMAMPTDELFTMASLAATPQKVMKMTQIIWYRSKTAPMNTNSAGAAAAPWEDRDPGAQYITIAPMSLRESFWTKLARPVQGIMYHGWQSLVPNDGTASYRYTHPESRHELRRLAREVVEPLGPALMQVGDRPTDVAFLESFTSQMFAQRGEWGWNRGWASDAYLAALYAQLQPEIIYEDSISRRGLDRFKVLFMMDCDVLTETIALKVQEFKQKGGIIVGDERLCPAIKADITLPSFVRTNRADALRTQLHQCAANLRRSLDSRYQRHLEADSPNLITRVRSAGTADYVFVVNDLREYGSYVGQYGLVMENGLPSQGNIALRRAEGYWYDLLEHRAVSTEKQPDGRLRLPLKLGPCEGKVFLVADHPIAQVLFSGSEKVKPGDLARVKITVADAAGKAISAVVPVKVEVRDPSGRLGEFSGYYGAREGQMELKLDLASNDTPGLWEIRVHELASGLQGCHYLRVGDSR
jgi:hypothetical protein